MFTKNYFNWRKGLEKNAAMFKPAKRIHRRVSGEPICFQEKYFVGTAKRSFISGMQTGQRQSGNIKIIFQKAEKRWMLSAIIKNITEFMSKH